MGLLKKFEQQFGKLQGLLGRKLPSFGIEFDKVLSVNRKLKASNY